MIGSTAHQGSALILGGLFGRIPRMSTNPRPQWLLLMSSPPYGPSSHISLRLVYNESYNPQDNERFLLTVVAKVTVQDSGQHERLVEQFVDPRFVRLDSNDAVFGE